MESKRAIRTIPRFISGSLGGLFVLTYEPVHGVTGNILCVQAFAEEMNKSRRMISEQARRLAALGYRVILPDLSGTGDSAGRLDQVQLDTWRTDIARVISSFEEGIGRPLWLWGHRLGALIALDVAVHRDLDLEGMVFWNPVLSGKQHMDQFFRIRSIASVMSNAKNQETVANLRAMIEQSDRIEIAGYKLTKQLVHEIDDLNVNLLLSVRARHIHWFEICKGESKKLSPAIDPQVGRLTDEGISIAVETLAGTDFWTAAELADAPELLEATVSAFQK